LTRVPDTTENLEFYPQPTNQNPRVQAPSQTFMLAASTDKVEFPSGENPFVFFEFLITHHPTVMDKLQQHLVKKMALHN
jgi:hypothetical protein